MRDKLVPLNREAVIDLIQHQQLKRWWVAEYTGVHKTTLRRWLSGRIEKISLTHLASLATILSVERSRLMRPGRT